MCNIWSHLDTRSKLYKELVVIEKLNVNSNLAVDSYCIRNNKSHILNDISNSPFICYECGKSYSNDNYIISHLRCINCPYFKCALCSIKERENSDLFEFLSNDQTFKESVLNERCNKLPDFGVCFMINSKVSSF